MDTLREQLRPFLDVWNRRRAASGEPPIGLDEYEADVRRLLATMDTDSNDASRSDDERLAQVLAPRRRGPVRRMMDWAASWLSDIRWFWNMREADR